MAANERENSANERHCGELQYMENCSRLKTKTGGNGNGTAPAVHGEPHEKSNRKNSSSFCSSLVPSVLAVLLLQFPCIAVYPFVSRCNLRMLAIPSSGPTASTGKTHCHPISCTSGGMS